MGVEWEAVGVEAAFPSVFKQGFFALQTRLVCMQKKASLQAKEGLFENEAECALCKGGMCLV